jgi:hypothetical protein
MPQIHFNVTPAVWLGSYLGSSGFKKNPPKSLTPAPPLLKKIRLTLAHPLKSSKEQNFGIQSLFDQLDADF